jgi:hypothetical protein
MTIDPAPPDGYIERKPGNTNKQLNWRDRDSSFGFVSQLPPERELECC